MATSQTASLRQPAPIHRLLAERDAFVVFQPIVDLVTRRTFAYEALARTRCKDFDGPLGMFKAAVDQGCTGELGRLLREMAVDHCPMYPLFLNLHPSELDRPFVVQPDDPLYRHSEEVYLEITEGVPISHFRLCQTMLHDVRARGVHLVVDDFGAGYSNIKYIADLHPKVVKLDRDLVAGVQLGSRMFRLMQSLVALCREMGARVVAEGIETAEELAAVCAAGVHFGQGYLLAKPAYPLPEPVWPSGV